MKHFIYIFPGIFFGIVLSKAEIASWLRIQEMFLFDSFHMYGIIGSAVVLGVIGVLLIKKLGAKTLLGREMDLMPKKMSFPRYLIGGFIFGLGWAMSGACPGPLYALLGGGYSVILVPVFFALLGTYAYGQVRHRLPH